MKFKITFTSERELDYNGIKRFVQEFDSKYITIDDVHDLIEGKKDCLGFKAEQGGVLMTTVYEIDCSEEERSTLFFKLREERE